MRLKLKLGIVAFSHEALIDCFEDVADCIKDRQVYKDGVVYKSTLKDGSEIILEYEVEPHYEVDP